MTALDQTVLNMLRCPVTHTALRPMSTEQLQALNKLISAGSVSDQDGNAITNKVESCLINEPNSLAFVIRGEIAQLVSGQAIVVEGKL